MLGLIQGLIGTFEQLLAALALLQTGNPGAYSDLAAGTEGMAPGDPVGVTGDSWGE